ncbi:MAG: hypothetical protein AMXMBFR68_18520 [Ignavibacteria bacterium]
MPKRERTPGVDPDKQIIALYARGASYGDIRDHLMDIYGLEALVATISRVTDKILPLIADWCARLLEAVYPFVWLDAIYYTVRHEGRVVSRAVYCVIGLNQDGHKELLGLYIGESEGAKFWLGVLTDLSNRGLRDMFIACIDNLTGFAEAIEAVFPRTQVQLCVIHQMRNSIKYLSYQDVKPFVKDLHGVYKATTIEQAERNLERLATQWGARYPKVIESWKRNWTEHLLRIRQRHSSHHGHHQHHRRLSPAASLRDEIQRSIPKRRSLDEATLPGSRTQYF